MPERMELPKGIGVSLETAVAKFAEAARRAWFRYSNYAKPRGT